MPFLPPPASAFHAPAPAPAPWAGKQQQHAHPPPHPPSPPREPRVLPPPAWDEVVAATAQARDARPLPAADAITHFIRPLPADAQGLSAGADWLGGKVKVQVSISAAEPATGAAALAAALAPTVPAWLPPLVAADAAAAAAVVGASMAGARAPSPPPTLAARLELVAEQRCSLFHCDAVGLRCLCTYAGPGTVYAPEAAVGARAVDRTDGFSRPARSGAGVDARAAVRCAAGDVLFLAGHLREGGGGGGGRAYRAAVHQSPPVPAGVTRLVLTVDDAAAPAGCACAAC